MTRISIDLQEDERKALMMIANNERRHPRQQAAVLIRRELQRRGLLPTDDTPDTRPTHEVQHANAT